MAAAAGIFNSQQTGQELAGKAAPLAASSSGTNGSNNSSNDSATISSNDFLTLLVTEMQNQDPTTATDPNEYINQLVEVNSLEQLVSINQTLSTDLGAPASGTNQNGSTPASGTTADGTACAAGTTAPAPAKPLAALHAPGNLSIPAANPAAQRVAHALDGRTSAQPAFGQLQ